MGDLPLLIQMSMSYSQGPLDEHRIHQVYDGIHGQHALQRDLDQHNTTLRNVLNSNPDMFLCYRGAQWLPREHRFVATGRNHFPNVGDHHIPPAAPQMFQQMFGFRYFGLQNIFPPFPALPPFQQAPAQALIEFPIQDPIRAEIEELAEDQLESPLSQHEVLEEPVQAETEDTINAQFGSPEAQSPEVIVLLETRVTPTITLSDSPFEAAPHFSPQARIQEDDLNGFESDSSSTSPQEEDMQKMHAIICKLVFEKLRRNKTLLRVFIKEVEKQKFIIPGEKFEEKVLYLRALKRKFPKILKAFRIKKMRLVRELPRYMSR